MKDSETEVTSCGILVRAFASEVNQSLITTHAASPLLMAVEDYRAQREPSV